MLLKIICINLFGFDDRGEKTKFVDTIVEFCYIWYIEEEKLNFDDYCVDKKKQDELFNQFQNHFMSNFHSKIHEYIKSKNCRSITSASPYVDAEIARKLKLPDNNYWKAINLLF